MITNISSSNQQYRPHKLVGQEEQMQRGVWKAYSIVFVSSFCVMVIELIAARILAPYIGVSLYTWTSIIGVILAGIALGNFLGGKLADKYPVPRYWPSYSWPAAWRRLPFCHW